MSCVNEYKYMSSVWLVQDEHPLMRLKSRERILKK